jgi:hypothetical protein
MLYGFISVMKKVIVFCVFVQIISSCNQSDNDDDNFSCEDKVKVLQEVNKMLEDENDALMLRNGELETEISKTK